MKREENEEIEDDDEAKEVVNDDGIASRMA